MPKKRYQVMTRYMPTVGSRGLDMMYRTATIQVNLDLVRRSRHGQKAPRLAGAAADRDGAVRLLAVHGRQAERFSIDAQRSLARHRSSAHGHAAVRIRTGGMGYERYVDYALDVPMYFVYRGGNYIDVAGASFRDFLAGRLKGFEGELPNRRRLVRSPDNTLPRSSPQAVPRNARRRRRSMGNDYGVAGLLDRHSLRRDGARPGLGDGRDWTAEERDKLRNDVPKSGFATRFRSTNVRDLARQALRISRLGLKNRGRLNSRKQDETVYLAPLEQISDNGRTLSDEFLRRYSGDWNGNIDHIFEEFAF